MRPTLETNRLILRPFELSDAKIVEQLAGAREIAWNTESIPHPYPEGAAAEWIDRQQKNFDAGTEVNFAITLRGSGDLIGSIGLLLNREHERGELGYWIAQPYWGKGAATEAAKAVIEYGFEVLRLNRIEARHFTRNPASGRVMQKAGMRYEGRLHRATKKWGKFQDVEIYALVRETKA